MLNLKIGIWNGWLFMSVFILQMLVIMFADKKIQNRTHIPTVTRHNKFERSISVIANFVWLLALIYSVFLPLNLENNWFYVGFIIFVIGVVLLAAATVSFMTTPFDELISKGIYRYSRHPMYLSTFFICLGTGIATLSLIFILLSLLIAVCFRQEALIEERICLEQYGSEYREYMERVPRWLGISR
jgi:protein-S-isoprenylcysteine O-methyltransferase Ste14